jgi:ADP-heptose:LPS heptosyltransferase
MKDYGRNLALLVTCFARAVIYGRAVKKIGDPKAICVVQTAQMGDMVCTTPMFRAIKKKYPDAKLYVIGTTVNKEVLQGNPDIEKYVVWQSSVRSMADKIRALQCDFACVAGPGFPTLAALYLAGVPSIAAPKVAGGTSPTETASYKLLRLLVTTMPHQFESYAPREYLRLLESIGIKTDDTKKFVYFNNEAKKSVIDKLGPIATGQYAVLSPSSGNKIKRWPPERFAEVSDYIAQKYMPVVVIGAVSDRDEVAQMMTHISNPRVLNLSEQLSVEELKALVAGASLFVSVDTGPLYIAEAAGVPTIDLVGPVSEYVQPPRGPRNIVLAPPRERPQLFIMNARVYDSEEARRQAEATTVKEVTGAVDSLFSII